MICNATALFLSAVSNNITTLFDGSYANLTRLTEICNDTLPEIPPDQVVPYRPITNQTFTGGFEPRSFDFYTVAGYSPTIPYKQEFDRGVDTAILDRSFYLFTPWNSQYEVRKPDFAKNAKIVIIHDTIASVCDFSAVDLKIELNFEYGFSMYDKNRETFIGGAYATNINAKIDLSVGFFANSRVTRSEYLEQFDPTNDKIWGSFMHIQVYGDLFSCVSLIPIYIGSYYREFKIYTNGLGKVVVNNYVVQDTDIDLANRLKPKPPTISPTNIPTVKPTVKPTDQPTDQPTVKPTDQPTMKPTDQPTMKPTDQPTTKSPNTREPTTQPTNLPTTNQPTNLPTTTQNWFEINMIYFIIPLVILFILFVVYFSSGSETKIVSETQPLIK